MAGRIAEWVAEAKRRRVLRTTGVYLVAVWGISSSGVDIASVIGIPESALRVGFLAALVFLPVVVLLAWRFDIGLRGIVRDPRDVLAQQRREDELAEMPTVIGGEAGAGAGAVVVRWTDENGESAALFVDEFFVGRGTDCRVRFYDPLVSRQHARVFHEDDAWHIEDLGSRNGTTLDGTPIQRGRLAATSEVRVNDSGPSLRIELVLPGEDTRSAMSSFPRNQPSAHVRLRAAGADTSRRSVTHK